MSAPPKGPLHIARLHDAPAQPWRNGGGVTHELLAWPALPADEAPAADWTVRVSVADITQDGPFSPFPGIDRCFTVLEGDGVVLALGDATLRLTPDDPPLAFDGASAPGCRLVRGPTRDLNLMVRRSAGPAWMQRASVQDPWGEGLTWRGLYTHRSARVQTPFGRFELEAGTLLWSDAEREGPWRLIEGGQAWWLGAGRSPAPPDVLATRRPP